VRQVGYLQRLYRDARSTEHKRLYTVLCVVCLEMLSDFDQILNLLNR